MSGVRVPHRPLNLLFCADVQGLAVPRLALPSLLLANCSRTKICLVSVRCLRRRVAAKREMCRDRTADRFPNRHLSCWSCSEWEVYAGDGNVDLCRETGPYPCQLHSRIGSCREQCQRPSSTLQTYPRGRCSRRSWHRRRPPAGPWYRGSSESRRP